MIDLFQSRRNYNVRCRWWSRKKEDRSLDNSLIMRRPASGTFWAKEASPENLRNNIVAGSFVFDSTHTMIKSPDDCSNLKNEDLVEYQGERWIVVSVQRSKARIQHTEYASNRNCSHYWYIELRK